jgi:autotransporter strand-loop-strand O-heptosyltransferase
MCPPDAQSEPAADEPALVVPPSPLPSAGNPDKRAYPAAAPTPTQIGPRGIRFDFNEGARVVLPTAEPPWQVRLRDLDTGNILFETTLKSGFVNSSKRYFIRFRLEVSQGGETVLQHDYDARGREVLILFPVGTLGDTVGWFPYAPRFAAQHGCKLSVAMAERLIPLFRDAYPDITFVTHETARPEQYYASYYVGLFFDDENHVWQPCDFRQVGLHRTAGYILGVDPAEAAPRLAVPDEGRPIAEPYVAIATQSTTQAKYWNNPYGWPELIRFLKDGGYRVVCIDQKPVHGHGLVWNHIPHGAEDQTGDRPLTERVRWLRHAEFFVGLSSGLSWLAWAAGVPVVMIAGFTHPINEFAMAARVINYHACNSCWNDVRLRFKHDDFLWCPRHAGTARQFECTRLITPDQVKGAIRALPVFASRVAARG